MTGLWLVSYIALWILFLLVALTLLSVLHNLGVIYESVAALSPKLQPAPTKLKAGAILPEINWYTLSDVETTPSKLRGVKTAISVVSPTCGPCLRFLKQIADNPTSIDPLDPTVTKRVIVSVGNIPQTVELASQAGLPPDVPIFVDKIATIAKVWGIDSTPATVIVDEEMRVVRQLFGA